MSIKLYKNGKMLALKVMISYFVAPLELSVEHIQIMKLAIRKAGFV